MRFYLKVLIFILYSTIVFGIFGYFYSFGFYGFIFGFLIGIISMSIHIYITISSLNRMGFQVSEETLRVSHTRGFVVYLPYDMAYNLCLNSLITVQKFTVKIDDRYQGIIIARNSIWTSWIPCEISFKIRGIDYNKTEILVSSRPAHYQIVFVDYGRNLDNVYRIESFIRAHGFDISFSPEYTVEPLTD